MRDHIGICVPTFKRPDLLRELLLALCQQQSEDLFDYSLHVVDNDRMMSAESVVAEVARVAPIHLTYDLEPVQNIAMARNRVVRNARGNFTAFIDDDETPATGWLRALYLARRKYHADGVLGPVRPLFGPDAPAWLSGSHLCERPSHETGTVLTHLQTRTGNVLFRRGILDGVEAPFPPERGRTGGEDIEFFRGMIARGFKFVWCAEAPVYERVTADRYRRRYHIDKELRIGGLTGEMLWRSGVGKWPAVFRSLCAMPLHASSAVAGLAVGHYAYVRHWAKAAYHFGRISGCFGLVPVRYRREV